MLYVSEKVIIKILQINCGRIPLSKKERLRALEKKYENVFGVFVVSVDDCYFYM